MKFWLDAQLSPMLAVWLREEFQLDAYSLYGLGLRDASDLHIFERARTEAVVLISKDVDFLNLIARYGPPPQLVWVTCGNTSNAAMKQFLAPMMPELLHLLANGESIIEVGNK